MTILSKLNFTDKARVAESPTPEARVRGKMLDAIETQIEAATAKANGEVYIRRVKRWVDDPGSGERVFKEVPVRFRPWWWTDESGKVMVEVRYGNKRLEIKPKKSAIEVGDASNLVPTLELLKEAVVSGELDKVLMAAKEERSVNFKRRRTAALAA